MKSLLDQIRDFENLEKSFKTCLRGKRKMLSPQKVYLQIDKYLDQLRSQLLMGDNYPWGMYKEFYVSDPKCRRISSAPFFDRICHRAIYNILDPILDREHISNSFACRIGKGNGRAVATLQKLLIERPDSYIVKLDVKQYFASIHHGRTLAKTLRCLKDESVTGLLRGLLRSHPNFNQGVGLPLGNLTSQTLANFYLVEVDKYLFDFLEGGYIRYMDDMVLVTESKKQAKKVVAGAISFLKKEKLSIPEHKRLYLRAGVQVPFLGFLVSPDVIRPLNRNRRRVQRKLRSKIKRQKLPSEISQSILSYEAWEKFPALCNK